MKKLLVTGGLGFIGSYFTDLALKRGYHVTNLDKKTYAARKDVFFVHPEYEFIEADICTLTHLPPNIDYIVNFAAESHVDNSIVANGVFFDSNIRGVYNLLELINAKDPSDRPVLVHISTDEVYGTLHNGSARESDILMPSSPYAATKAAGDQLIHAWKETYGIRSIICRSCNNYGYGQYPEKLFAKTVEHLSNNKQMTVHGNGSYKREWMYAGDNCEAILSVLERGTIGEIYNISSNEEYSVIDVVRMIAETMKPEDDWQKWVQFIPNRWGQDIRYSIDCQKIHRLGWSPKTRLQSYIPLYLEEYRKHNAQDVSTPPLSISSR